MKRFILRIVLFFSIILIADVVLGRLFSFMVSHAVGGDNGRVNYICNQTNEDMLIFGSSRANHHYNPQILMDSLSLSVYNCGEDGNGIILNYGRLLMIEQRYMPKYIIYDVSCGFDLETNDNHKYIGKLKPYYERKGIKDVFVSVDMTEKWKMLSQLYRYNSSFLTVFDDYLHPNQSMGFQGYRPYEGKMDVRTINSKKEFKKHVEYDSLKLAFMAKFIEHCNDVKMIFAVSPVWYGRDTKRLRPVIDLCKQHGILFLDFSNDSKFVHNNEYFKDDYHLNAQGADEFTKDLIQELRMREII